MDVIVVNKKTIHDKIKDVDIDESFRRYFNKMIP